MDLLIEPVDPAFPTAKAPYVCTKRWDGGPFLSYAHRERKTHIVPALVRFTSDHWPETPRDTPYSEYKELEAFYQTWLFFGLIAEFFGLNERCDGGMRHIEPSQAAAEMAAFYDECIVEEDGRKYITGAKVLSSFPLLQKRIQQARPTLLQSTSHLRDCLAVTYQLLQEVRNAWFDRNVKYSIAALGEFLMYTLRLVLAESEFDMDHRLSYAWQRLYLEHRSLLSKKMLAHGWCPSEIERASQCLTGLNTLHYVSRLKRTGIERDHAACTRSRCVALQIDMDVYKPAHAAEGCACDLLEVDMDAVMEILTNSNSYPVLLVEEAPEALGMVKVTVEKFQPDVPYVAISHVSTPCTPVVWLIYGTDQDHRCGQTVWATPAQTHYQLARSGEWQGWLRPSRSKPRPNTRRRTLKWMSRDRHIVFGSTHCAVPLRLRAN
jgi:hypothetical protein